MIAAVAVGVARRAPEEATGYAVQRRAFGQSIAEFQAVGHKLADIATGIEAARLLAWRAAAEVDTGLPNTAQASMEKAFATDLAMRAAVDAVQIFGAAGIMRHNPVEKLMRDAKVLQVYEGTNEIQRNIVVRELLRPHASALRRARFRGRSQCGRRGCPLRRWSAPSPTATATACTGPLWRAPVLHGFRHPVRCHAMSRTAFVLSGGASFGAIQVGGLAALLETG